MLKKQCCLSWFCAKNCGHLLEKKKNLWSPVGKKQSPNIATRGLGWALGSADAGVGLGLQYRGSILRCSCKSPPIVCWPHTQNGRTGHREHFSSNIYRYLVCKAQKKKNLFLQEKEQRSMDVETARVMLGLLLGKHWSLFPSFNQYLEVRLHDLISPLRFAATDFLCEQLTKTSWIVWSGLKGIRMSKFPRLFQGKNSTPNASTRWWAVNDPQVVWGCLSKIVFSLPSLFTAMQIQGDKQRPVV